MACARSGEARLISTGCVLDEAEPHGDCLTFGLGHYETWLNWRRDRATDPELRSIVHAFEYEDWPLGHVFDRARDRFILYADRKLMTPRTVALIHDHFGLPTERTIVEGDGHYRSRETPPALV